MTVERFDLEWMGGVAERHFRKVRPGVDEMPWGTLDPSRYPAKLVERARESWTGAAFQEYCTAAAFAELLSALLAARAPIDLVGMASDFVADELLHVELTSRIAMELGGGVPMETDFDALGIMPDRALSPVQRANEIVVRACCVGEAFSLPMLALTHASASHPLTKAVLHRIVQDEAPHGRFGWLYLDWASDSLDDAERVRLAGIAKEALDALAPLWQRLASRAEGGVTTEGYAVSDVNDLGWAEASAYAARARESVQREIVAPLARHGIVVAA